jgi:hypothetical protein
MPANDAETPAPKGPDTQLKDLERLIRDLAFCPAVGDAAPAVLAARAWVDQDRSRTIDLAPKRPQGQS